jgi:chemotaxis protein CheD
VLAHIVLPESSGRTGSPGKFANTAVPHMLNLLDAMGIPRAGRMAKITGGANMFAAFGPLQVGDGNVEAVTRALSAAGIHITGKDVGGTSGRRLTFDCSSGELLIECVGKPPRTL